MLELPLEPFILGVNARVVDKTEHPVGIHNANNTVNPCSPVGWSPSMVGGHGLNSLTTQVFPAFRPFPRLSVIPFSCSSWCLIGTLQLSWTLLFFFFNSHFVFNWGKVSKRLAFRKHSVFSCRLALFLWELPYFKIFIFQDAFANIFWKENRVCGLHIICTCMWYTRMDLYLCLWMELNEWIDDCRHGGREEGREGRKNRIY